MISHDLGVVEHVSDRVAVMYLGRIVEQGGWQEIFEDPRHPYTRALIAAIPDPFHRAAVSAKAKAKGEIASALNPPPGCHFHPRCPLKADRCVERGAAARSGGRGPSRGLSFPRSRGLHRTASRMKTTDVDRITDWLVRRGLEGAAETDLLREFCEKCNAAGPRDRARTRLHRHAASGARRHRLPLAQRRRRGGGRHATTAAATRAPRRNPGSAARSITCCRPAARNCAGASASASRPISASSRR